MHYLKIQSRQVLQRIQTRLPKIPVLNLNLDLRSYFDRTTCSYYIIPVRGHAFVRAAARAVDLRGSEPEKNGSATDAEDGGGHSHTTQWLSPLH